MKIEPQVECVEANGSSHDSCLILTTQQADN